MISLEETDAVQDAILVDYEERSARSRHQFVPLARSLDSLVPTFDLYGGAGKTPRVWK